MQLSTIDEMDRASNISEFFCNRDVLITGGSGFLGKVLIEKLLRSCPTVGRVYLILRPKKGLNSEERLRTLTESQLFGRIRSEGNGHLLEKLIAVEGNISEIGLGLSQEDEKRLIENVSVVLHAAASVRFEERFKDAILTNTRGTREVVNLALKMKNTPVFAHVSTAYSNCNRINIEERMYPPVADWRKTIETAEKFEDETLDVFKAKYIGDLPNTYTFAKQLAEHVVKDMCQDKIPAFILRPSIVILTYEEPFPAWCDSFTGSTGLTAGMGLGILRIMYSSPDVYIDNVPVDLCIKGILIGTWLTAAKWTSEKNELPVYNASSVMYETIGNFTEIIMKYTRKHPLERQIWLPAIHCSSWRLEYKFYIILQLLIFAMLDLAMTASGRKPLLVKLLRKIYAANETVRFFTFNNFSISNKRFLQLENQLQREDVVSFRYNLENYSTESFMSTATKLGRSYLLRENPENYVHDEKKAFRNTFRYYLTNSLIFLALSWLLFVKLNTLGYVYDAASEFSRSVYNFI